MVLGCANHAWALKAPNPWPPLSVHSKCGSDGVRSSYRFGPTSGFSVITPGGIHPDEPFKPQVGTWLKEKQKKFSKHEMASIHVCRPFEVSNLSAKLCGFVQGSVLFSSVRRMTEMSWRYFVAYIIILF